MIIKVNLTSGNDLQPIRFWCKEMGDDFYIEKISRSTIMAKYSKYFEMLGDKLATPYKKNLDVIELARIEFSRYMSQEVKDLICETLNAPSEECPDIEQVLAPFSADTMFCIDVDMPTTNKDFNMYCIRYINKATSEEEVVFIVEKTVFIIGENGKTVDVYPSYNRNR